MDLSHLTRWMYSRLHYADRRSRHLIDDMDAFPPEDPDIEPVAEIRAPDMERRCSPPLSAPPSLAHIPFAPHFDPGHPRYRCCGRHVRKYSRWIAFAEIALSVLSLIVAISIGATVVPAALGVVTLCTVLHVSLKLTVTVLLLVGLKRQKRTWIIPYLVTKCLEIASASIGLLVCFLGLFGYVTFVSMLATSQQSVSENVFSSGVSQLPSSTPGDVVDYGQDYGAGGGSWSDDAGDHDTMGTTGTLCLLVVCMFIVLGLSIWFFIVAFKCFRFFQERSYFGYQYDLMAKHSVDVNAMSRNASFQRFFPSAGPGGNPNHPSDPMPNTLIIHTSCPCSGAPNCPPYYTHTHSRASSYGGQTIASGVTGLEFFQLAPTLPPLAVNNVQSRTANGNAVVPELNHMAAVPASPPHPPLSPVPASPVPSHPSPSPTPRPTASPSSNIHVPPPPPPSRRHSGNNPSTCSSMHSQRSYAGTPSLPKPPGSAQLERSNFSTSRAQTVTTPSPQNSLPRPTAVLVGGSRAAEAQSEL